jgi:cytochrome c oxidase subunit 3
MAAGREHFQSLERQTEAARLGMWVFLGSEVLFFAVLFALYASYRVAHGHAFAEGVHHNELLIGTVNTYILLTSSLIVALGVYAIRSGRWKITAALLTTAAVLGVAFLILKGIEYSHHFKEGIFPGPYYEFEGLQTYGARVFFTLYYFMTGLHALHVFGGIIMLLVLTTLTLRRKFDAQYHTPIELGGMYWHFVDIVWLFLWPLFYLLR